MKYALYAILAATVLTEFVAVYFGAWFIATVALIVILALYFLTERYDQ